MGALLLMAGLLSAAPGNAATSIPEECRPAAAAVAQVEAWRQESDKLPSLRIIEERRRQELARCLAAAQVNA